MKAAWISRWTRPTPGRETKALEVFMESMEFWDKRIAEGQIEGRDVCVSPAGPGMVIVKGERAALSAIMDTEDYLRLVAKIDLNVDGVEGEMMLTGESVDTLIGIWAETAKAQGYM
jgi:hypothetical protein